MKKIDISVTSVPEVVNPTWYGVKLYRYRLETYYGALRYFTVQIRERHAEVLEFCKTRFTKKERLKLFCNGRLLAELNYQPQNRIKRILDRENGRFYNDVREMADFLQISPKTARIWLKTKSRFKTIREQ